MHSDTCIFLSGVRAIHIIEPRISKRKVKIAQPHPLTPLKGTRLCNTSSPIRTVCSRWRESRLALQQDPGHSLRSAQTVSNERTNERQLCAGDRIQAS